MTKLYLTVALCIIGYTLAGQDLSKPLSSSQLTGRSQTDQLRSYGYQTAVPGWVLNEGDTLALGKGSMPNKDFAFIYENPGGLTAKLDRNGDLVKDYLSSSYANRRLIVKSLGIIGGKRVGFTAVAIVGMGNIVRDYVEIESAIESGEMLPPARYRKTTTGTSTGGGSVADELLKLKSLLDAGAITQQEYDIQKKKLLN